jgi:hypothetical protein
MRERSPWNDVAEGDWQKVPGRMAGITVNILPAESLFMIVLHGQVSVIGKGSLNFHGFQ